MLFFGFVLLRTLINVKNPCARRFLTRRGGSVRSSPEKKKKYSHSVVPVCAPVRACITDPFCFASSNPRMAKRYTTRVMKNIVFPTSPLALTYISPRPLDRHLLALKDLSPSLPLSVSLNSDYLYAVCCVTFSSPGMAGITGTSPRSLALKLALCTRPVCWLTQLLMLRNRAGRSSLVCV